ETLEEPTPTIRVDDFQEKYIKILILVWFPNEKYWDGYTEVKRKIAEAFRKEELEPPQLRVSTAGQKSPAN
ncbi:MAG: mechanosensitive ion channel family protein, partial [Desulfobacterales bacterium]|nr:mechanosensitive ion channel family protein [Desulfobacterales bacterium]